MLASHHTGGEERRVGDGWGVSGGRGGVGGRGDDGEGGSSSVVVMVRMVSLAGYTRLPQGNGKLFSGMISRHNQQENLSCQHCLRQGRWPMRNLSLYSASKTCTSSTGSASRPAPQGHYAWQPQQEGMTGTPTCRSCHYSCYGCSGPQDYECTKCWGDAELYSPSKNTAIAVTRWVTNASRGSPH
ncbi:hypothetical protein GWK47_012321 [Chionoecetes opilio]|uniref:Uncharacterized protein n=1 Tax=Chionoecetes opilio TaxID=41210 RepID=A0A8J4XW63_CHIOP|nr:hypothetical protein GWK47_012321 [Chionoecetes opilio]